MDVLEAIRTTRTMRRLDPARDVAEADPRTIVEAATKAANGGNRQPVRWLVGRDAALRCRLGEVTFWDRWGQSSVDGGNDDV